MDVFRSSLREFGYDETKNVRVEFRFASGFRDVARELAGLNVEADVDSWRVTPFAGVPEFGRFRSKADIARALGADRFDAIDPKQTFGVK